MYCQIVVIQQSKRSHLLFFKLNFNRISKNIQVKIKYFIKYFNVLHVLLQTLNT